MLGTYEPLSVLSKPYESVEEPRRSSRRISVATVLPMLRSLPLPWTETLMSPTLVTLPPWVW